MAYGRLAWACILGGATREACVWANRQLELAQRLGDTEVTLKAACTLGMLQFDDGGLEKLEESLESAQRLGLVQLAGQVFLWLANAAVDRRRYDVVTRYLGAGTAYCSERGLELFRFYLLAYSARFELDQGHWSEAADRAESVLAIPRTSTTPRIIALVVLGLVGAGAGIPEHGLCWTRPGPWPGRRGAGPAGTSGGRQG